MTLYRFAHKTGVYGVTIKEETEDKVLVQVEQVIKHPKQGDLHHPTETENVFFHERRALSHYEKRYTPKSALKPFNVEVMNYEDSLQQAITDLENKLKQQDTNHAQLSLKNLSQLKEDYGRQYKHTFK
ncbi:kinase-associated protein B [Staphylococcus auricularis]|uniref:Kinase n=1 Tax=Staphylococcus auricularis TaxID=29379 RepID=A0AAP8PQ79_9STAP|nr:kinase-associated lipoprotein B [Staphylococcus auricularis]MBM0868767.1 kinase [Staphylococcus auricularis]MCG7341518.1 kinase-associated lipoprotein B [Staphylococcus auricularis]MDC6326268.1 kinase-associated lipoprotein B [Staphylococcus auricularis]MDN4533843.1 kinase-associated lipoprotein B [Staphylococcus auricularis]PNZ68885.1 kinase [Staphylococcus auricularis]